MNHDELVEFLAENALSFADEGTEVHIETEAHYNHYGKRGAADLVVNQCTEHRAGTDAKAKVMEAKTHLDEAHKVIRQFKKMSRFFYKDEDRTAPESVTFELVILPTLKNVNHLLNYKELYRTLSTNNADAKYRRFISFRGPKEHTPIILFPSDPHWQFPSDQWWTYAEKNPHLAKLKDKMEEKPNGL